MTASRRRATGPDIGIGHAAIVELGQFALLASVPIRVLPAYKFSHLLGRKEVLRADAGQLLQRGKRRKAAFDPELLQQVSDCGLSSEPIEIKIRSESSCT